MERLYIIPECHITSDSIDKYEGISFEEFEEFFFIDSLINIKLSHYHQYIKFKFTISGEDPFAKINGSSKPYSYSKTFLVNKFDIAKIYHLSFGSLNSTIVYVLYDKNGKNVLAKSDTKTDSYAAFAQAEFTIANGIDNGILTPISFDRQRNFSLEDTIINKIIETSVWKLINPK